MSLSTSRVITSMTDSNDSDQASQHRIVGDQFAHPCREVLPARRADLQPGFAQQRPHAVLDVAPLVEHHPSRGQQRTPGPAGWVLHMHRAIPAGSHDLRDPTRVVAIGLVWHRTHRRLRLARLDADRHDPSLRKALMQPGRQRARLEANPLHYHSASP